MDSKDALGTAIGLALGAGLGLIYRTMTGNIALWMPIGAALGDNARNIYPMPPSMCAQSNSCFRSHR
jgi:hypothetical protein